MTLIMTPFPTELLHSATHSMVRLFGQCYIHVQTINTANIAYIACNRAEIVRLYTVY